MKKWYQQGDIMLGVAVIAPFATSKRNVSTKKYGLPFVVRCNVRKSLAGKSGAHSPVLKTASTNLRQSLSSSALNLRSV